MDNGTASHREGQKVQQTVYAWHIKFFDIALRDGIPDALVVDIMLREINRHMGSFILQTPQAITAMAEQISFLSDTLLAFPSGRKKEGNLCLPLAVFAINNSSSTLGGKLTPCSYRPWQSLSPHPVSPRPLQLKRIASSPCILDKSVRN